MKNRGLTLVEVMVSTLIIALVAGAVFKLYSTLMRGVNRSYYRVLAWEQAKREMEALKTFQNNSADFAALRGLKALPQPVRIFPNCSVASPPGALNRLCVSFNNLPESSCAVYVQPMLLQSGSEAADLLKVEVVVNYRAGTQDVVGEDRNLDGNFAPGPPPAGEDRNADGRMSSPVSLVDLLLDRTQ